jgi:hypothetical protein
MTSLWLLFTILAALLVAAIVVRTIKNVGHRGTTPHPHRHPPHD